MKYFPLLHRLEAKRCLIVGGGNVALRRAEKLVNAGAIIDVVAVEIQPELRQLVDGTEGQCLQQEFSSGAIDGEHHLVIAVTDSEQTNTKVAQVAKGMGIPVNVASDQSQCDFIFPSIIDRDPLTIAVSNSGASPVLSRILKQQLEMFVPDAYGQLAGFVGEHRAKVNAAISDVPSRISFWEKMLTGVVAEAVFSGNVGEAERLLLDALGSYQTTNLKGEVYLIGAGPGDPDLLTLRAFRLLQQSDVVVYDRLVSPEVMALIPKGAELIYVGKERANHSLPQGGINQLLVDLAQKGKRVARLKGGDPFVFGRGGEEIETLVDYQVPFQVVPGITAANGCSAYAGIPLTHRNYAQSVQFITGQLKDGTVDLNWSELVAPGKTLVFYMGLKGLPQICSNLIEHGKAAETPLAIIERGTTQSQRVVISTIEKLPKELEQLSIASPSLLIVGEVVELADKLEWFN